MANRGKRHGIKYFHKYLNGIQCFILHHTHTHPWSMVPGPFPYLWSPGLFWGYPVSGPRSFLRLPPVVPSDRTGYPRQDSLPPPPPQTGLGYHPIRTELGYFLGKIGIPSPPHPPLEARYGRYAGGLFVSIRWIAIREITVLR